MCSVTGEDVDGELQRRIPVTVTKDKLDCSKCKASATASIFIQGNAVCRNCFMSNTEHKFRAELTKFLKELGRPPNENKSNLANVSNRLIFGFSGSLSSVALLHLLMSERERRRISSDLDFLVLFVRQPGHSDEWVAKVKDYLQNNCNVFPWMVVESENIEPAHISADAKSQATLLARYRTIANHARKLRCDGAIFSSCQTSLAIALLRDVSLGYAERAAYSSAVVDKLSCFGVPLGRPFRALSTKEVSLLFRFMNMPSLEYTDLAMSKYSGQSLSIGNMCQAMIAEVGAEYPATASTVFRTGSKLEINFGKTEHHCSICYCFLEESSTDSICYGCQSLGLEKVLSRYVADSLISNE